MITDSIPVPILIFILLASAMLLGFLFKPKARPDKPRAWDRDDPRDYAHRSDTPEWKPSWHSTRRKGPGE
jgi:hypothetical protein